ncbi:hypothetical protein BA062_33925 [Prauserella flavalba]|uniref:Uncharacterized protein n=1 Tax=Prauserella flavalba TaxID=1477506 RepID=A0A318LDN2_9PSEU|nr:hypothetical protein BA062_33925 [Prauserella flavalba]
MDNPPRQEAAELAAVVVEGEDAELVLESELDELDVLDSDLAELSELVAEPLDLPPEDERDSERESLR